MPSPSPLDLELDLECFQGPFDLLLALVLREELDLLEVELADVVLAYLDHLDQRGELELETATEFLVLIAALLELKSRLMLPGEDLAEELEDLGPAEAAEELLARMLQYLRYRGAAGWLGERYAAGQVHLHRSAPPPRAWRAEPDDEGELIPELLGEAVGRMLRTPPPMRFDHLRQPRVTVGERLEILRALLRRASGGRFDFEEAVRGADRQTEAMTVWALLELYKRGEGDWEQSEPFGPITVAIGPAAAPCGAPTGEAAA